MSFLQPVNIMPPISRVASKNITFFILYKLNKELMKCDTKNNQFDYLDTYWALFVFAIPGLFTNGLYYDISIIFRFLTDKFDSVVMISSSNAYINILNRLKERIPFSMSFIIGKIIKPMLQLRPKNIIQCRNIIERSLDM